MMMMMMMKNNKNIVKLLDPTQNTMMFGTFHFLPAFDDCIYIYFYPDGSRHLDRKM
jgi:hypothetical protein